MFSVWMTRIAIGVAAKKLVDRLRKSGWMPQNTYVYASLQAHRKGDLAEAVRQYRLAIKRKGLTENTELLCEILTGTIDMRKEEIEGKLEEINRKLYPPFFSKAFWRKLFRRSDRKYQELRLSKEKCLKELKELEKLKDLLDAPPE